MTSLYFNFPAGGLADLSHRIDEVQQGAQKWAWGPREWTIWEVYWQKAADLCERYGIDARRNVRLSVTALRPNRIHKGGVATSVELYRGIVTIRRSYATWDSCTCSLGVPGHLRERLREAGLLEAHPATGIWIGSTA